MVFQQFPLTGLYHSFSCSSMNYPPGKSNSAVAQATAYWNPGSEGSGSPVGCPAKQEAT
jgi:hypothetical protein